VERGNLRKKFVPVVLPALVVLPLPLVLRMILRQMKTLLVLDGL
jgi:hypothetical protein